MPPTFPKTGEDHQLHAYWRATPNPGALFTEVRLGGKRWPKRPWKGQARERRLDGVIIDEPSPAKELVAQGHGAFAKALPELDGRSCEIIEVKAGLSEFVLGQALVGRWMFEAQVGLPVRNNVVLARHHDPAMRWVAKKLDVTVHNPRPLEANKKEVFTRSRPQYALRDAPLLRVGRYRDAHGGGGTWLTRVPLGGDASGVKKWKGAAQTWIGFVRVPDRDSDGIVVFDPKRHHALLDSEELELVVVSRHLLGRGAVGVAASHALMFAQQYGRPFARCRIVCWVADPAIVAACGEIGGRCGVPEIDVVAVGKVAAADVEDEAGDGE